MDAAIDLPSYSRLQIAIGIATQRRPGYLKEALRHIKQQTRQPELVVIAFAEEADLPELPLDLKIKALRGKGGSSEQRNRILNELPSDIDVVLFLDDDFLIHWAYLEMIERAFLDHPSLVVGTGTVLADGIKGPGLSPEWGRAFLAATQERPAQAFAPIFSAYGCNMAFRLAPIREHRVRFDENLPLYGWYEDLDLSRRLSRYGILLHIAAAQGVHLGAKGGRTSGLRLGYSQVANPLYLFKKGVYPFCGAVRSILKNCIANFVRSLCPEPFVDRRGRLRGNLLAYLDLLRGRLIPTRILQL